MIPCAKCGAVPAYNHSVVLDRIARIWPACKCYDPNARLCYRDWAELQDETLGETVSDLLGDSATVARVTALIGAGIESERLKKLHAEDDEIRTLRINSPEIPDGSEPSAHDDRPECEQPDTAPSAATDNYPVFAFLAAQGLVLTEDPLNELVQIVRRIDRPDRESYEAEIYALKKQIDELEEEQPEVCTWTHDAHENIWTPGCKPTMILSRSSTQSILSFRRDDSVCPFCARKIEVEE